MTRVAATLMFGCCAALAAGCADMGARRPPGYSVQFIAANSATVLVDYARGQPAEREVARQVALERCALFGGNRVVLESLNIRGGGEERATFLCQ